jgi:hypothetical protein
VLAVIILSTLELPVSVGLGNVPDKSPPAVPLGGSEVGIAVSTNAVVAIWVVLVLAAAVGAVGVPVKAGLARGALEATVVLELTMLLTTVWTLLVLVSVGFG